MRRLFVIAPYLPRTGPSTWLYQLLSHFNDVEMKIYVLGVSSGSMGKDFQAICEVEVGGETRMKGAITEFRPDSILYWEIDLKQDDVGQIRTILIYHSIGVFIGFCDKIICPHEHIQNWIRRNRPDITDKTIVIYSAVNPRKSDENLRSKFNLNSPILGYVGRFVPEKNIEVLIEAVAGTDWTLILVGDGPDKEKLINQSKQLRSKVVFIGELENIWSAYKAMDVLCLPSKTEGFSFVTIEAALSNIPMLLTKVGASPFIFDTDSVFWTTGESENIRNNLLEIRSNPNEVKRKIMNAKNLIEEKCSIERMVKECYNVLFNEMK